MTVRGRVGEGSVVAVVGLLVAASLASGVPGAFGFAHDTEPERAAFGAADDLTVAVENRTVSSPTVTTSDRENVTVSFPLRTPDAVNESRVTVSLAGSDTSGRVAPAAVDCDDRCAVVVDGQDVVRLANGPGEYELVVRGWWEYDRKFVVVVPISVETPSATAAGDAGTATPTNDTQTTANDTQTTANATTTATANATTSITTNETTTANTSTTNGSTTTNASTTTSNTSTTTTTPTATTTSNTTATTTTNATTTAATTTTRANASTSERRGLARPTGPRVAGRQ